MPRIVDLSMPIADHFRWKIERSQSGDLAAGDPFQSTRISLPVHAFTHMDAGRHILAEGPTTDEIPLERTVGDCAVVDLSAILPNAAIEAERIAAAGAHVRTGDIVLLTTGWDRTHSPQTPQFWSEAPFMSKGACQWLLEKAPTAVAFDFPQDYPIRLLLQDEQRPFEEFVTHHILLREGVTLIEYLCNTSQLERERTFLCALPLKVPAADGAPARVIAIEEF